MENEMIYYIAGVLLGTGMIFGGKYILESE